MKNYDVVIIGGGCAGISAVIWCKRLGLTHLMLEKKDDVGGQLSKIHNSIIDYPGVLTENGKELQEIFSKQVSDCHILFNSFVENIDPKEKTVTYKKGETVDTLQYKYLVVATGSKQRNLNVPGEKEMIERGEVYSATRDRFLFKGKTVAIVGGGDRAFEGAILLAEAGANVLLIHHSTSFRAKKMYKDQVLQHDNITLYLNSVVKAIHRNGETESIEIDQEGKKKILPVSAVFVRIGVTPNNDLVEDLAKTDADGYLIVDKMGRTSDPFIFAIGDVSNTTKYSSIAASIGQGMISVKHIYESINEGDEPILL